MGRVVAIGEQSFEEIVKHNYFYVDKTQFIRDWWKNGDSVTVLTRPRRFGKTLLLNTVDHFFSVKYQDEDDLFKNLTIANDSEILKEQNKWPVIFLSFADVKMQTYDLMYKYICDLIDTLYNRNYFLIEEKFLNPRETEKFNKVNSDMDISTAQSAIKNLSEWLSNYYGKKVIILLDEYDTPLYEIFASETNKNRESDFASALEFMRGFFNSSFKTNPAMGRVLMTGLTYIAKQSLFSDFNNPKIITTTSNKYTDSCGFTQEEMEAVFDEYDISYDERQGVKDYYDGYIFGNRTGIYNPWSVCNFLDDRILKAYWVNSSSDNLITNYIRVGSASVQNQIQNLINGKEIITTLDERVTFANVNMSEPAFYSICVSSGYLKICDVIGKKYKLNFPNKEIRNEIIDNIQSWFTSTTLDFTSYENFINALLSGDLSILRKTLTKFANNVFSFMDTAKSEPEKFYHGFTLGVMVGLPADYMVESNGESGNGRYDIMIKPRPNQPPEKFSSMNGIIIELKSVPAKSSIKLQDAVNVALKQIDAKNYAQKLLDYGIQESNIIKYGIAFKGKKVNIGMDISDTSCPRQPSDKY